MILIKRSSLIGCILSIALLGCSIGTNDKEALENSWLDHNLKGEVHSYTEVSYKAVIRSGYVEKGIPERDASIEAGGQQDEKVVFNRNGMAINCFYYHSNGSLHYKYINKYDDELNLIQQTMFFSTGDIDYDKYYFYDSYGNLIKVVDSVGVYHTEQYIHKNNSKGEPIETEWYIDGELRNVYILKYSESDYLLEESTFDAGGKLNFIKKFDENGNVIEEVSYDNYGNIEMRTVHVYDINGNETEYSLYDQFNILYSRCTSSFDENGNLIEEYVSYGAEKYFNTYDYVFDKQGNWVKKIKYRNGVPTYIVERQYKYFD